MKDSQESPFTLVRGIKILPLSGAILDIVGTVPCRACDSWRCRRTYQAGHRICAPVARALHIKTCVSRYPLCITADARKHQVHLSLPLSPLHTYVVRVSDRRPAVVPSSSSLARDFTSWCLPGNRVITRSRFPNAVRVPRILKQAIFVRHARLLAKAHARLCNAYEQLCGRDT